MNFKVTRADAGESLSHRITFTAKRGQIVAIDGASAAGKPAIFHDDVSWKLATGTRGFYLERDVINGDIPLENFLFEKSLGLPDQIRGDGLAVFADAVTTNASATLTSATAAFVAADVGRTIVGAGIPDNTTILAVGSGTSITLSAAATATATGVSITIYGRDGTAVGWVSARKVQECEMEGTDLIDASITTSTAVDTEVTTKAGKIATLAAAQDAVFTDAATTNASATLTSATAAFTAADIGKRITGAGIPNNAVIQAVGSGTSITLSANATATATGVTITIVDRGGTGGVPNAEVHGWIRAQLAPETAGAVRVLVEIAALLLLAALVASGLVDASGFIPLMGLTGVSLGNFDKKTYLKDLQARATLLQPMTAARVGAALKQMEENLSPDSEKKLTDLILKARAGDQAASAALVRMRVITVENFVMATTNTAAFFDEVPLEEDEKPIIQGSTRPRHILVSYLGQDGRARKTQLTKETNEVQVDLHIISTEEVEYQLRDIYTGDVKTPSLALVDLADDLQRKIQGLHWPFLKAAIGPFRLTGNEAQRVYVPDPQINVKNLPKSNLLVTAGNTSTSLFRKESMDAILKYAAAWGTNSINGVQLKPVSVLVPSSEVMGFLDQITLTSAPNSKVEEIFANGWVLSYGGTTWTFIGDATLDPDEGMAYVRFNRPVGSMFTKPSMDQTFVDETINMQKQNKGSVSMNKVIGWGLLASQRIGIAGVRYHTPR